MVHVRVNVLVDEAGDTLDATTAGEAANGGLDDASDDVSVTTLTPIPTHAHSGRREKEGRGDEEEKERGLEIRYGM